MDLEICPVKLSYHCIIEAMFKPIFGDEQSIKKLIKELTNDEVLDQIWPEEHSRVFIKAYAKYLKAEYLKEDDSKIKRRCRKSQVISKIKRRLLMEDMEDMEGELSRACMHVNDFVLEVKDKAKRDKLEVQLEALEVSIREALRES